VIRETSVAVLTGLLLLLGGCSEGGEVREWKPSDHDHSGEEGQVPAGDEGSAAASGDVATDVVYRQNCAGCHAADGSGQTPMAAQMRVRDLRASTLSEEELIQVISKGRARMPAFGQSLDPEGIRALSKKILAMRRD
jgi:mono/diheme cytochrome c family protein